MGRKVPRGSCACNYARSPHVRAHTVRRTEEEGRSTFGVARHSGQGTRPRTRGCNGWSCRKHSGRPKRLAPWGTPRSPPRGTPARMCAHRKRAVAHKDGRKSKAHDRRRAAPPATHRSRGTGMSPCTAGTAQRGTSQGKCGCRRPTACHKSRHRTIAVGPRTSLWRVPLGRSGSAQGRQQQCNGGTVQGGRGPGSGGGNPGHVRTRRHSCGRASVGSAPARITCHRSRYTGATCRRDGSGSQGREKHSPGRQSHWNAAPRGGCTSSGRQPSTSHSTKFVRSARLC